MQSPHHGFRRKRISLSPTGIPGRSRAKGSYFRLISTIPAVFPMSSTTKCHQNTWLRLTEPTRSGFPEMLQNGVWRIVARHDQLVLVWDRLGHWGSFSAVPWCELGTRLRFPRGLSVHGTRLKRLQPVNHWGRTVLVTQSSRLSKIAGLGGFASLAANHGLPAGRVPAGPI